MKAILLLLAFALMVTYPWLAVAALLAVLAACGVLGWLVARSAAGRMYPYPPAPWRSS